MSSRELLPPRGFAATAYALTLDHDCKERMRLQVDRTFKSCDLAPLRRRHFRGIIPKGAIRGSPIPAAKGT